MYIRKGCWISIYIYVNRTGTMFTCVSKRLKSIVYVRIRTTITVTAQLARDGKVYNYVNIVTKNKNRDVFLFFKFFNVFVYCDFIVTVNFAVLKFDFQCTEFQMSGGEVEGEEGAGGRFSFHRVM